jgi:asparagine synthase (glutamine-hydrolysing)
VLRQVLDGYVPRELIERPKVGFSIPLGSWLRGPLRGWAEALIDHARLVDEGYLNADMISSMWHQHISGRYDRSTFLWNILMFQAWYECQKN